MIAAEELGGRVGVAPACRALGVTRATLYRRRTARTCPRPQQPRRRSPRALTIDERLTVLAVLSEERFCDLSPLAAWAILLDEGRYLCSVRTMYRILGAAGAVRERRNQLRHPAYKKPELLATSPNQVWSWDITKLRGPLCANVAETPTPRMITVQGGGGTSDDEQPQHSAGGDPGAEGGRA